MRPFIPYAIDETIDVRVEEDRYVPCFVVSVHHKSNDLVYDVELSNEGSEILVNVPAKDLRRKYRNESDNEVLAADARVMVLYRDADGNADDYYPGRIIQYNKKRDSYDIQYDDGEVAYHIKRRDIMTQS